MEIFSEKFDSDKLKEKLPCKRKQKEVLNIGITNFAYKSIYGNINPALRDYHRLFPIRFSDHMK